MRKKKAERERNNCQESLKVLKHKLLLNRNVTSSSSFLQNTKKEEKIRKLDHGHLLYALLTQFASEKN